MQMMTFLVQKGGASLECRNKNMDTPLLLAARKGHMRALKLLVELGARTEVMDR